MEIFYLSLCLPLACLVHISLCICLTDIVLTALVRKGLIPGGIDDKPILLDNPLQILLLLPLIISQVQWDMPQIDHSALLTHSYHENSQIWNRLRQVRETEKGRRLSSERFGGEGQSRVDRRVVATGLDQEVDVAVTVGGLAV